MTPVLAWLLLALCWGGLVAAIAHDVHRKPAPRSRAFCPSCSRDLLNDERVGVYERVDGTTELRCVCDCVSRWDLDAPVPLLVRE